MKVFMTHSISLPMIHCLQAEQVGVIRKNARQPVLEFVKRKWASELQFVGNSEKVGDQTFFRKTDKRRPLRQFEHQAQ